MPIVYDTSLFNIAMQMNKQAWQGIAEARQAAVQTKQANLQARVAKDTAMSEMIGGLAKGLEPVAGSLGGLAGGAPWPGTTPTVTQSSGWAQSQSGRDMWGGTEINNPVLQSYVRGDNPFNPFSGFGGTN